VVKVLKRRMENAGLSIPQFAARAGVGRGTVYALLTGCRKGSLTLSELIRYATALGITPLQILREAGARFLDQMEPAPPVAPLARQVERGPVVPGSSTLKPPPRRV
jgi:transcriptional regulator with XRE-family HTH domain